MSTKPWHRRYHSDALAGFFSLSLEERGAYQTLLDMMYDRGGPVMDNERLLAGYMGCSIRKWKTLRESLLAKGKITVNSKGELTNSRVKKELENDAKTSRKLAESGSKGGRNRVENEKNANENKENDQAPLEHGLSLRALPLPLPEEEEEPLTPLEAEKPIPPAGRKYAFSGKVIRLTVPDFAEWAALYHAIPDLRAELAGLDRWFQRQSDAVRGDWFFRTSNSLNRKHQEMLKPQSGPAEAPDFNDFLTQQRREEAEFRRSATA